METAIKTNNKPIIADVKPSLPWFSLAGSPWLDIILYPESITRNRPSITEIGKRILFIILKKALSLSEALVQEQSSPAALILGVVPIGQLFTTSYGSDVTGSQTKQHVSGPHVPPAGKHPAAFAFNPKDTITTAKINTKILVSNLLFIIRIITFTIIYKICLLRQYNLV